MTFDRESDENSLIHVSSRDALLDKIYKAMHMTAGQRAAKDFGHSKVPSYSKASFCIAKVWPANCVALRIEGQ